MTEGSMTNTPFTPRAFSDAAHLDATSYASMYARSLADGDTFWAEQAERFVDWFSPWDAVHRTDFVTGDIHWFEGAKLNVAWNCLDRHLENRGDQPALIWEGDDPEGVRTLTYRELHEAVCRFANALKGLGVKRGDRVCLYLPQIPETTIAMLACARIGAIHSIVFSTFSPGALRDRIEDAGCSVLITADGGIRSGRKVPIKANADLACSQTEAIRRMVVIRHANSEVEWQDGRDLWYHDLVQGASAKCPAVEMNAEDPLFILYTSGATARPKGVLHTAGGYLLYAAMTHHYVLDHKEGDVMWCAADLGWITAHTYAVYGPLANGATTVIYEGNPRLPGPERFWQVLERHGVTTLYTAPTVIRALMAHGDAALKAVDRSRLRVIGTVGEQIDPATWTWLWETVGESRCPIIDTWWQTETGGVVLSALPGAAPLKPGATGLPFFGIEAALLDDAGEPLSGQTRGQLVLSRSWPGQARSIWGDHERFVEKYFADRPGQYVTGDTASRDADGDYWITGHQDDAITVSGERLGTVEIETALMSHPDVAEAAVVAYPHPDTGQGVYAWVTPMHEVVADEALKQALREHVRAQLGDSATPDLVQWAPGLPKTRSGKILRRILKKIVGDDSDDLGDTSTLADPSVVDGLVERHRKQG